MGQAAVDVGEPGERPLEDGQDEEVGACEPRRHHPGDVPVGHDRALEHGVVARGGAHPEDVPRVLDAIALGAPGHEGVDDLRSRGVARVHAVEAEEGPHRGQASEVLVPGEAVATVDPLRLGRRQEHRDVVPLLGVTGGVDLAVDRAGQHPLQRFVARPPQVGRDSHPVEVHVDPERGRVGVGGEAPLLVHHLREGEPAAAQLARHRRGQIARLLEVGKVLARRTGCPGRSRGPGRRTASASRPRGYSSKSKVPCPFLLIYSVDVIAPSVR